MTEAEKQQYKILIIDDDKFLQQMYGTKFKKEGLKIAFKHRKSRAMTTCMMGQTVIVSEVKVLREE